MNHPSLRAQSSIPRHPSDMNVNPYGTLQSVGNRQQPDSASLQQQPIHQPPAPSAALNHYGTMTSISANNQQSPSRQMNHYGTLASINSSTLNNNRFPPTSHSSPYSQFNGIKDDQPPSSVAVSAYNNYSPNNNNHSLVAPDSPTSNQSGGGPILPRQSLSQYPRSSPEGSGSYPMYGNDTHNKSAGTPFVFCVFFLCIS